jgi:hypothetical protein
MSCVLRVSGSKLAVDDLLPLIPLSPTVVWHAGEPRLASQTSAPQHHETSGFTVAVSEKRMDDFSGQIEDAITFMQVNGASLTLLLNHPGVEDLLLDFAVARRDIPATFMHLPSDLIAEASKFRMSLEISQYATSD